MHITTQKGVPGEAIFNTPNKQKRNGKKVLCVDVKLGYTCSLHNVPSVHSFADLKSSSAKRIKSWAKYIAEGYKVKGLAVKIKPVNKHDVKFTNDGVTFYFTF